MVWGSMVSRRALAGALSGSKAVPVTTTVSIPPAPVEARIWACAALDAKKAPIAKAAVERRSLEMVDMNITPLIEHAGKADARAQSQFFCESALCGWTLRTPSVRLEMTGLIEGPMTLAIRKINLPAACRPVICDDGVTCFRSPVSGKLAPGKCPQNRLVR